MALMEAWAAVGHAAQVLPGPVWLAIRLEAVARVPSVLTLVQLRVSPVALAVMA